MAGFDEPFNGRVDGSGINRGSTSAIKQRVKDRKGHDQCCSTGLCTAMPCILMLHGIRLPTTHIPCLHVIPLTYLKSLAEQARTRWFAEQPRKTPRITTIMFSLLCNKCTLLIKLSNPCRTTRQPQEAASTNLGSGQIHQIRLRLQPLQPLKPTRSIK